MANVFQDSDNDSAFADDESFWTLPMSSSLSMPLAGSKRGADNVILNNSHPAAPAQGLAAEVDHQAEHIDPKVLSCRTCADAGCLGTNTDSRPSKRRASALKVGEYHKGSSSSPSWKLPDESLNFPETCFEKFCQDCDWEASCTETCNLPCGETECLQDDACWDPHCSPTLCADECVDPECRKTTASIDDPCFCQQCDAQPCPLGEPNNECHLAHSAPNATGTIYCYDNTRCHFQEGYHGFDSNFSGYESYPCFSQVHEASSHHSDTIPTSTTATPTLSPSNYTSLESAFSTQPSPAPKYEDTAPHCFLNIPSEHCHIDNSCCHGTSRACGDCPTAPQEHLDLWNASIAQGNGLANNLMNFGLDADQSLTSLSLPPSATTSTVFDQDLHASMLGYDDSSWMIPGSHYSTLPSSDKVASDLLTPTIQHGGIKVEPSYSIASMSNIGTDMISDDSQPCICKWQHAPGISCLAIFDNPKALHEHMKTAHVDNCMRCFCQWEGCEAASKDFKQRSKLSRHLLSHAGYRPYACSFEGCNKTFATNQAKDNHERTHTGERPYVCDKCGYTTTTYTQLQTHISALHEGKKPHKCRYCDFSCADSSNLSKHERTHQTLRPYRCPHVSCTFKPDCRWENLKRHLRRSGHCPQLLVESSEEYKSYRENVRREIDEWNKRNEDGGMNKMARRKGRG